MPLLWGWLACGALVLLMLGCAHAGMSWTGAKPVRATDVLPRPTRPPLTVSPRVSQSGAYGGLDGWPMPLWRVRTVLPPWVLGSEIEASAILIASREFGGNGTVNVTEGAEA